MGSITEQVMSRAACACLVVKPQVGAGDTYRMKSAASSSGAAGNAAGGGGGTGGGGAAAPAPKSPVASPIYGGRGSQGPGGLATPFNRRVAIAYDTTASGRCAVALAGGAGPWFQTKAAQVLCCGLAAHLSVKST